MVVGKVNDNDSSKIQGQVAEQGLLLLESKLTQRRSRLHHVGRLQQGHSLIPMDLRNRVSKPLDNG
jgi:hypothetical protein